MRQKRAGTRTHINAPITGHFLLRRRAHQLEFSIVASQKRAKPFRQFLFASGFRLQIIPIGVGNGFGSQQKRLIIQQRRIEVRAQRLAARIQQG